MLQSYLFSFLFTFIFFCIMAKQEDIFKNVVSHAKEYGFIFPSSEIYDGLRYYDWLCAKRSRVKKEHT
jgi:hypothetical protein